MAEIPSNSPPLNPEKGWKIDWDPYPLDQEVPVPSFRKEMCFSMYLWMKQDIEDHNARVKYLWEQSDKQIPQSLDAGSREVSS